MKQKLTLMMAGSLLIGAFLLAAQMVWSFERQTPSRIPPDHIFKPFFPEQEKIPPPCIIQNDDGAPRWFYPGFDWEMGVAVYMDPANCTTQPVYPFNVTDVHFYLYHNPVGWSWPVHIQVNIKEVIQGDKCLGPDSTFLFSQSFTIPVDSSYDNLGRPMILSLTPQTCVSQPFFLEIKYQDHFAVGDTIPSFLMDSAVTSIDTCNNWFRWVDGTYYEWSDAWEPPPPGDVFIRASGYTNAECWYWKPERPSAPNGMPDFDQNQDAWQAYCGPVAVANCLWWFGAVPVGWTPPQLIDTLARYFHTNPVNGTWTDTMQIGLSQYFNNYGFAFQESTFLMPTFSEMEDSLKISQDIILLLGFWWTNDGGLHWYREGGHFVTMAGVYSESLKVAFSDPDTDNAESGGPGRVLPPHAAHPLDHTLHNNPSYVSQDIYNCIIDPVNPSPGSDLWEIADYISAKTIGRYSGMNVPQRFIAHTKPAPKDDVVVWHTEVEFAVMICPQPSAVEEDEGEASVPQNFELYQNHPNPFNSETVIKFNLLKPSFVTIVVYNILGQKVRTLVKGHFGAGQASVNWDGKDEKGNDLSSGIYFYQLNASGESQTKRLVLLK
jgi:hypothetical protein